MTIPKRDKRRKRGEKSPLPQPQIEAYVSPSADKMVRTPFPFWTRVCPYCGQGSLSTICKCGRLTVFKNKVVTK